MSDRPFAGQRWHACEDHIDQSHGLVEIHGSVERGDARAFLAAMLQGVQAEDRQAPASGAWTPRTPHSSRRIKRRLPTVRLALATSTYLRRMSASDSVSDLTRFRIDLLVQHFLAPPPGHSRHESLSMTSATSSPSGVRPNSIFRSTSWISCRAQADSSSRKPLGDGQRVIDLGLWCRSSARPHPPP